MTSSASAAPVLLGLGANVGDPVAQLRAAAARMGWLREQRRSGIYRSAPVGLTDQPDFYNAVVAGTTTLDPAAVLGACRRIEDELGRVRAVVNGPRTIDVDVLGYGEHVVATAALVLPHPRMHERAFVLVPLAEVAPTWRHPTLGATAAQLLDALGAGARVERVLAVL